MGGSRDRVDKACSRARALLTGTALLTDVYFLYPPPQIALAAVWAHDAELVEFFLHAKFGSDPVRTRLVKVLRECAEGHLMATKDSPNTYPGLLLRLPQNGVPLSQAEISPELKKEVHPTPHPATDSTNPQQTIGIDKKLYLLKKPLNATKGKHAATRDVADVERRAKKQKIGQEKRDKDDVFGGATIKRK